MRSNNSLARLLAVIGTRPQFIKYGALSASLDDSFETILVDTGQHYDPELSSLFLEELTIRKPDRVLKGRRIGVAGQLADMIQALDAVIRETAPDAVLCMGDTNSTLAASLSSSKNEIPIAHIEAGERNVRKDGTPIPPWAAPEEANRRMVDQVSSLLLCATRRAVKNLDYEGRSEDAVFTGDLMWDLHQRASKRVTARSKVLSRLGVEPGNYYYCTVHRAINTDDPERLERIVAALQSLDMPIVFPMHPRTRRCLKEAGLLNRLWIQQRAIVLEPVTYLDSIALSHQARCVITDSGGVTREAFFSGVPSVLLDESTAWIDIVEAGWAELAGADPEAIRAAVRRRPPEHCPKLFGDGRASTLIVRALQSWLAGGTR